MRTTRKLKLPNKGAPAPSQIKSVAVPTRRNLKVGAKAVKAKPVAKKAPRDNSIPMHDENRFDLVGASGPVRSGRRLSPVILDRVAGAFTPRDRAFLEDLHTQFKSQPFERLNFDGGLMSRLAGSGYLTHVSGNPADRTARFAVTKKGVERLKTSA